MAININPVNGRLELTTSNVRLGKLNPGIATDEAVNMSQYNSLDSRITSIEEGTESLTIVEVNDGSVTAPSITFASDLNTGLYRIGADNLGITSGGTKIVDVSTAGIAVTGIFSASTTVTAGTLVLAGNGAVATPSFSFTSDTDTGLYRIGVNNLGIAAGGTKIVDIASTGAAITGTLSATTTITAGTLVVAGDGTFGAPSFTFTNDLDCGLYRIGINNIGFSAGGNKILDIGTAGLGVTGSLSTTTYLLTGDGSVAAPAYSFLSDTDTGLYRIGVNNAGFACNGAKVLDISGTGLGVTGTITATTTVTATTLFFSGDGAVAAPTYSFVSDTDTGIYRIGTNNIGIAANGAKVVDIATTGVAITGTLSATTTVSGTGHLYTGSLIVSGAGTPQTLNTYAGTVTMTGVSNITATNTGTVVINNSLVTASSVGSVSLQTTTAAAQSIPRIESVTYGIGTITIVIRNSAAATDTGAATYTFSFILFKL